MVIDISRNKDRAQDLMDKYKELCRQAGVQLHRDMVEEMGNVAARSHETVEKRAWRIAVESHKFSADMLDRPEFYALKEWWAMQFNSSEREWAGQRLLDLGALEYSRGVISGYTNT